MAETLPGHSNGYLLDEEAMVSGIALHAAVALEFLARQPVPDEVSDGPWRFLVPLPPLPG